MHVVENWLQALVGSKYNKQNNEATDINLKFALIIGAVFF